MGEREGGMYAIIPMAVMRCPGLTPKAILLYGEIQTLANTRGYCWATNEWFADLYGITPRAVSSLIGKLVEKGFISIEIRHNVPPKNTTQRWIRVTHCFGGIEENFQGGMEENFVTPLEENFHHNNTSNNIIKPPKAPKGGKGVKSIPKWEPERFEGFWKLYPRHEDRIGAVTAWDRLKPDDDLLTAMGKALLAQIASPKWREGIGIPHAVRWLKNRRWEDEVFQPPEPAEQGGWAESEVL